jgi:hypothetical protein
MLVNAEITTYALKMAHFSGNATADLNPISSLCVAPPGLAHLST